MNTKAIILLSRDKGHNFGMQHDSTGNACDGSSYIMAARGSSAARPDSFSTCSVQYMQNFVSFVGSQLTCLDNKPLSAQYAVCRNGFVELGENCDCGQEDCTLAGDKCCDGSTCGLFANAGEFCFEYVVLFLFVDLYGGKAP